MNKARIVLSAVALFAVVGGALAFKAMRTGSPVITTTTRVAAHSTFYGLGGATFYYTRADQFFTDDVNAPNAVNVLTTTAVPAANLTLTRIGGSEELIIPNFGTVTANVALTKTTNID